MKDKKSKSAFSDPGGGYRSHTQVHKGKTEEIDKAMAKELEELRKEIDRLTEELKNS